MKFYLSITLIVFSLVNFLPIIDVYSNNHSVIISEINYSGSINPNKCKIVETNSNRCSFDKWIELYNTTSRSINLNGWSLRFKDSTDKANNIVFEENISLPPNGYYLIAYNELNFDSNLPIEPNGISGKILRVSNNTQKTVKAELINSEGISTFSVSLTKNDIENLEEGVRPNEKHSIEFNTATNSWILAKSEYTPNNYGSPKKSNIKLTDLDNQEIVDTITVAPKPDPKINKTKNNKDSQKKTEPPKDVSQPKIADEAKKIQIKVNEIKKVVLKPQTATEFWREQVKQKSVERISFSNDYKPQVPNYSLAEKSSFIRIEQPILLTINTIIKKTIKNQELYALLTVMITYIYLIDRGLSFKKLKSFAQNSLTISKLKPQYIYY